MPAAVKRLRNGKNDRKAVDMCVLPTCEPIPPWNLSAAAKVEWKRITKTLGQAGLLAAVDGDALVVYCNATVTYQQASRLLDKVGPIVKDKRGFFSTNPALRVQRDAITTMTRFHVEFGMTPSARTRVMSLNKPPAGSDPFDAFVNSKPK